VVKAHAVVRRAEIALRVRVTPKSMPTVVEPSGQEKLQVISIVYEFGVLFRMARHPVQIKHAKPEGPDHIPKALQRSNADRTRWPLIATG
jgi:hypothetical protein